MNNVIRYGRISVVLLTVMACLRAVVPMVVPQSWAPGAVRATAEGCYQDEMAGERGSRCAFIRVDLDDVAHRLGPVQSFRLRDVSRGVRNDWYTARIDVTRKGRTSGEEIEFLALWNRSRDSSPSATAMSYRGPQ